MSTKIVPIFYACDDAFVKYTIVSLKSMIENASKDYLYKVYVLNTNIGEDMKNRLSALENENFEINFTDVTDYLNSVTKDLPIRHYYSKSTYYRFFIAEMFPEYSKAIYIDSDTIVLGDISKLYETDIGDSYLGACHEQAMVQVDVYGTYCERVVGVSRHNFFNAGLMLINCQQFRNKKVLKKFLSHLWEYNFVVTQDEDYLNLICKDQVFWLDQRWNTELTEGLNYNYDVTTAYILHYIMVNKPWHYHECRCADIFWSYAEKTSVYDMLKGELDAYTDEQRERDRLSGENLAQMAYDEIHKKDNYQNKLNETKRSKYRVQLLKKIEKYEREGRFDEDVEDDPPSRMIMPDEIDYLRKSPIAKVKTRIAHEKAKIFLKKILDKKIMIIKDIKGVENWANLDTGAIVTCNHFNAFDSFAIQEAYHATKKWPKNKFYRVIREGNYTSFPGFFGELMRHFYTLPLSSNMKTMVKFTEATNTLLKQGNFVLFYPEQAMWWNYRKPRPLKPGAFKFAVKNNVPVLPCFITMKDSDILGEDLRREIRDFDVDENFVPDGYYVQEYTIHIGKPIYPDPSLTPRENMEYMAKKNFKVWKEIYEKEYCMPLTYLDKEIK
ncbi:MAG: 1-acyl-sn-glycerol-3-phosphate acyltransferase [Clostridia bacterium]|nr:1-acyl-sn-glycerol-3-phosphate acyltransferase [Clostridia bacterium]